MHALSMRFTALWLVAAGIVGILALPGVSEARGRTLASCAGATASAREATDPQLVRATLCLLNVQRAQRGLPALRLDNKLTAAAERHSRDMVRRRYFAHDSLGGASFVDRIRRTGYLQGARSWAAGENLAWGSGTRSTPLSILRAWMNSSGHRANILDGRFREIGIGVVEGAPIATGLPAATYTTDFGRRS